MLIKNMVLICTGGAPKGSDVRILRISDHDIQACGGTHHDDLRQIGSIRVVRSTAVQDGVEGGCKLLPETLLEIIRENRKNYSVHPLRYLVCRLPIYHEPQRDSLASGKNKREN